jgi:hypothetical protein
MSLAEDRFKGEHLVVVRDTDEASRPFSYYLRFVKGSKAVTDGASSVVGLIK